MTLNKEEFLEILRDYLKRDFPENEVNDILRDYEEYFVDGLIEGKSNMEIISSLGSPKAIAKELVDQIKESDSIGKSKKEKLEDGLNKMKIISKEKFGKVKRYISNKLTIDINNKNHGISRKFVKLSLSILSLLLLIPSFIFVVTMAFIGIGMVASIIAFLISIPVLFTFISNMPEVKYIIIFASMIYIGVEILSWQIFIFIIKVSKGLYRKYINWIKTRKIYINASQKKEDLDREYESKENQEDINIKEGLYDEEGDERDE